MNRQLVAHHYCSHLNQDVRQCVIYDSDRPDARLIGIEYIINEDLFEQLPAEEKKLWHSHVHEVKSGELIAPGVPDIAEKEVMKELVHTYGKTFHSMSSFLFDSNIHSIDLLFFQPGKSIEVIDYHLVFLN